jgi:hypothetical protein
MTDTDGPRIPQDTEGKIAMSKQLKDTGNGCFKEGQFGRARVLYSKAVAYVRGLPGRPSSVPDAVGQAVATAKESMSAERAAELNELEGVLHTNIAMCHLKQNHGFAAIESANMALRFAPHSWKAQLRKAEGKLMVKDYEDCLEVLAAIQCPDAYVHSLVQKLKEQCRVGMQQEAARQKKTFANMFSKMSVAD